MYKLFFSRVEKIEHAIIKLITRYAFVFEFISEVYHSGLDVSV